MHAPCSASGCIGAHLLPCIAEEERRYKLGSLRGECHFCCYNNVQLFLTTDRELYKWLGPPDVTAKVAIKRLASSPRETVGRRGLSCWAGLDKHSYRTCTCHEPCCSVTALRPIPIIKLYIAMYAQIITYTYNDKSKQTSSLVFAIYKDHYNVHFKLFWLVSIT